MIRTLKDLKKFECSCLLSDRSPEAITPPPGNYDITNYIFTQEIDCAPSLVQPSETACKDVGCTGMKTVSGVNKCYSINYDDIIKQFADQQNFINLRGKKILPTPDKGSCLFISIVEFNG